MYLSLSMKHVISSMSSFCGWICLFVKPKKWPNQLLCPRVSSENSMRPHGPIGWQNNNVHQRWTNMNGNLPTKNQGTFQLSGQIILQFLHSGKLTWQWKMDPLKMYFLVKMGIFHCMFRAFFRGDTSLILNHQTWGDQLGALVTNIFFSELYPCMIYLPIWMVDFYDKCR